jgi:PAS domain S-box-containing protein
MMKTMNQRTLEFPELLLAQGELAGMEHYLGQIIKSLPGAFYVCNAEGKIIYYNEIAAALWGREPELGVDLWCGSWKIFQTDGSPLPLDSCPMAIALKEGRAVYGEEIIVECPDGRRCNVLPHPRPIFNTSGIVAGAFNILVDITPQKKIEEELKEKNTELTKINSDLDNFIYTASHDLKAPVSNIEGLIEYLKEAIKNKEEEESETILKMIDKSISRFKTTILDLTEISKANNDHEEDLHLINCEQIIEDVKFVIGDKIRKSDAKITLDIKTCDYIHFSRKNFKSIIYNLLSNAIKYQHPDRRPEILIRTEKSAGGWMILSVTDNGLGIKNSYLPKLFTMFKRFHDHVEGSGIGLYIIKRIIDNAGGKIEVESEQGKGSTFRIFLKHA